MDYSIRLNSSSVAKDFLENLRKTSNDTRKDSSMRPALDSFKNGASEQGLKVLTWLQNVAVKLSDTIDEKLPNLSGVSKIIKSRFGIGEDKSLMTYNSLPNEFFIERRKENSESLLTAIKEGNLEKAKEVIAEDDGALEHVHTKALIAFTVALTEAKYQNNFQEALDTLLPLSYKGRTLDTNIIDHNDQEIQLFSPAFNGAPLKETREFIKNRQATAGQRIVKGAYDAFKKKFGLAFLELDKEKAMPLLQRLKELSGTSLNSEALSAFLASLFTNVNKNNYEKAKTYLDFVLNDLPEDIDLSSTVYSSSSASALESNDGDRESQYKLLQKLYSKSPSAFLTSIAETNTSTEIANVQARLIMDYKEDHPGLDEAARIIDGYSEIPSHASDAKRVLFNLRKMGYQLSEQEQNTFKDILARNKKELEKDPNEAKYKTLYKQASLVEQAFSEQLNLPS